MLEGYGNAEMANFSPSILYLTMPSLMVVFCRMCSMDFDEITKQVGDPIDIGCGENNIENSIEYAYSISSSKRIRVVKGWQWMDIVFNERHLEAVKNQGLLPSLIFCENLIYDSRLFMTISGGRVRTSLLQKFHKSHSLFETKNSHYILCGSGERKTVKAELVFTTKVFSI